MVEDRKKFSAKICHTFQLEHFYCCSNLQRKRDVNGLHETKDYDSCGSVIPCFEVIIVTREQFILKFTALGQTRNLTWTNLRSSSKNTSLVTTMTSKTNHHYSTANKCLFFLVLELWWCVNLKVSGQFSTSSDKKLWCSISTIAYF